MRGFALLPLVTVAILFVLVGIPVIFVVLQAVFPWLDEGSMREPMSAFIAVAQDPRLGPLLSNTFGIGIGGCIVERLIGGYVGYFARIVSYSLCLNVGFVIPDPFFDSSVYFGFVVDACTANVRLSGIAFLIQV